MGDEEFGAALQSAALACGMSMSNDELADLRATAKANGRYNLRAYVVLTMKENARAFVAKIGREELRRRT